jgi:3-methyladenine DNA glycosylase AlkC
MTKKSALHSISITKEFSRKKYKNFGQLAAEAIMTDCQDRRGIKHIMNEIKEENPLVFRKIKKTWEYIIMESLKEFKGEE